MRVLNFINGKITWRSISGTDLYIEERPYPKVIYDLRESTVHRLIQERDARNTTGASYTRLLLALCLDYK
jgi:hypothetical protein